MLKKKYKVNPFFERLSKIKFCFNKIKTEANEEKEKKKCAETFINVR